jgi:hypothetical protein
MLSTGNPETGRNENRIAYTKSHRNAGGFLNQDTCYLPFTHAHRVIMKTRVHLPEIPYSTQGKRHRLQRSRRRSVSICGFFSSSKTPGRSCDHSVLELYINHDSSTDWNARILIVLPRTDKIGLNNGDC